MVKEHLQRADRVRRVLENESLEALLVSRATNIRYLTGFTGSAGLVLLTPARLDLFTDYRYELQAEAELREHLGGSGYQVTVYKGREIDRKLAEAVTAGSTTRVGFEEAEVSVAFKTRLAQALEGMELVPAGPVVEGVRAVKDRQEVNLIERAAAIGDEAFTHILEEIRAGVCERDIALEIEFFMRKNGAEKVGFDVIVASGPRSAMPHARAGERILADGDLVKLDFGAVYEGYHSDMTRTLVLGRPGPRQRQVHQLVLEARRVAFDVLEPGISGGEVDGRVRAFLAGAGEAEAFGHNLGHGVGLNIHEKPVLGVQSEDKLEVGTVFSIEPGLYYPGFGGVRVEDLVVMEENGPRILTDSRRRLELA